MCEIGIYQRYIKPIFDYLLVMLLTLFFIPVFLMIVILQLLFSQQVFFIQERPGFHSELFKIYKFKTMDEFGEITRFGSYLRKSSLDELPQLYNVWRGEMSFVGPRPLFKEYLEIYTDNERNRHCVKPGITGLAQVNGRNKVTLSEKVRLDLNYVQGISFLLDLKIIFLTVVQVFKWKESDYHTINPTN